MARQHNTLLDLDMIIKRRSKKGFNKRSKSEIEKQKKFIKSIEKRNAQTKYAIKKLKVEQITRGTSRQRVRQIDKILESEHAKIIPLQSERNYLKMIEGKDFYYIIDNGFEKQKIKSSTLSKMKNASQYFTKRLIKLIEKIENAWQRELKNKKLTTKQKKVLKKKIFVLNKLLTAALYNERVNEGGDDEQGEGEYPLLMMIYGEHIRINS